MKLLIKTINYAGRWSGASLLVGVMVFAFVLRSVPAYAADDGLFSVDRTGWMSLDRYDDKKQRFPGQFKSEGLDDEPKKVAPPPVPPKVADIISSQPPVAVPIRPLNLPSLPSVNGGYDVRVSSTEDEGSGATALLKDLANEPKLAIRDTDWINAKKAARLAAQAVKNKSKNSSSENLGIRYADLPKQTLIPTSLPTAMKGIKGPQTPVPTTPEAKKDALDPAVCAAVNALKKRQLQAIESDRKTLAALQAAIAELGIGDKLDLSSGASGSVSQQAVTTTPAAPTSFLDAQPVTQPTAKN